MKSMKSALMVGVLALSGLVAIAAPASAYDDNHGRDNGQTIRVPYNDTLKGVAVVQAPAIGSAFDDNHGNNTVVKLANQAQVKSQPADNDSLAQVTARRARVAAEMDAQRLRD